MKRIIKEPLLHFLLLGAGIFLAYGLMPRSGRSGEPASIVVTQGQIDNLAAGFAKAWQRPPTSGELADLIEDRVREEVYSREAVALGLDKDDAVIRRRLRQKMEFLSDDIAAQPEPSDADLNAHLQTHPDSFRIEPRFTFRQVYLDPKKHGEHLARDAAQILEQLNQAGGTADPSALGDPLLLEQEFAAVSASEVTKQFGGTFATRLGTLTLAQWQGPVESGYGLHLVLLRERTEGRLPALAEVRDGVRREWENARRLEANENFYQALLRRYSVTIEGLEPTAERERLANSAK